jgi:hypothetical protein
MSSNLYKSTPRARKLIALLTDDEWRALRVEAARNDTTIQAYVTNVLLRDLSRKAAPPPRQIRDASA